MGYMVIYEEKWFVYLKNVNNTSRGFGKLEVHWPKKAKRRWIGTNTFAATSRLPRNEYDAFFGMDPQQSVIPYVNKER